MQAVLEGSKYVVEFNGAPEIGCYHDTDCSGTRLCAYNQTWSALPAQCTCQAVLGLQGFNCDERGPLSNGILVCNSISMIISFTAFSLTVTSLVRNLVAFKKERRASPLVLSLCISMLTCSMAMISESLIFFNLVTYPTNFAMLAQTDTRFPDRLVRRQPYEDAQTSVLVTYFIFLTLDLSYLSLVWLSVAIRFQRLSHKQSNFVEKACMVYTVFALCILLPLALVRRTLPVATTIIPIVMLLLAMLLLYTAYKFRALHSSTSSSDAREQTGSSNSKVEALVIRIGKTALALGVVSVGSAILLALFGIGPERNGTYQPPVSSRLYREYAHRAALTLLPICTMIIAEHLTWTIRMKIKGKYDSSNSRDSKRQDGSPRPKDAVTSSRLAKTVVSAMVPASTGTDT